MERERLRIKLLIDGDAKRVVLAEAGQDFVDLLTRFLSLPLSTVVSLVDKDGKIGSLANLHVSTAKLRDNHLAPPNINATVLDNLVYGPPLNNLMAAGRIGGGAIRPHLISLMAAGKIGGGGAWRGKVTYMVMDDLTVTPMSISELIKLNVKSVADLEEKIVFLGEDEAVKLLSVSLHSKNVLTDVFLKDSNVTNGGSTSGVKRERTS